MSETDIIVPPCIVASTKIWAKEVTETRYRWISVQDLHTGIEKNKKYNALSHFGNDQKILEVKGMGFHKVFRLTTFSGCSADVTDTIAVRMMEEWYLLQQLQKGHRIMEYSIFQKNVKETIITEIKLIGEKTVFSLKMDEDNSFIGNGIIFRDF